MVSILAMLHLCALPEHKLKVDHLHAQSLAIAIFAVSWCQQNSTKVSI
jgi:hypothetical protein